MVRHRLVRAAPHIEQLAGSLGVAGHHLRLSFVILHAIHAKTVSTHSAIRRTASQSAIAVTADPRWQNATAR